MVSKKRKFNFILALLATVPLAGWLGFKGLFTYEELGFVKGKRKLAVRSYNLFDDSVRRTQVYYTFKSDYEALLRQASFELRRDGYQAVLPDAGLTDRIEFHKGFGLDMASFGAGEGPAYNVQIEANLRFIIDEQGRVIGLKGEVGWVGVTITSDQALSPLTNLLP